MNTFVQPLIHEIESLSNEYKKMNRVQPISFEGYLTYTNEGNRTAFESDYFQRRKQLAVLVIDHYLHPEERDCRLLESLIWEICNEFTWAVPAHLPRNIVNKEARKCIDLFAAETAQTLSEASFLLKDRLSMMIQERVTFEIKQRIFVPYLAKKWFWESSRNNWNAVVPCAIGMTALYELQGQETLQLSVLTKVEENLGSYLEGFGEDGACEEGIGYWAYGFGYYLYYSELYERLKQDDKFFKKEKVKKIAEFPYYMMIAEDSFIPFSDYTNSHVPSGLITFCRQKFKINVPVKTQVGHVDDDHCYRFAHLFRTVLWGEMENNQIEPLSSNYFPDVQWFIAKHHTRVFAAKAGNNNESHNHNDVGNFILSKEGQLFLTDLGAGAYEKDYFDEKKRYAYLVNSSRGHSVPIINQQYERSGPFKAENIFFEEGLFSFDLQAVYPSSSQLALFNRTFKIEKSLKKILITDKFAFDLDKKNSVLEVFVTLYTPKVEGNTVFVYSGQDRCKVMFQTEDIQILEEEFLNHNGEKIRVYLIQARYELTKSEEIRTTILLDEE